MKRFIALVFVFLTMSCAAPSCAWQFSSLADLQRHIMTHTPDQLIASKDEAVITGTVLSVTYANMSNHWDMLLAVDDPHATAPIGHDTPVIDVHFRLHKESVPFNVGDVLTVRGDLNILYSSYMIPCILADTINGSDDF